MRAPQISLVIAFLAFLPVRAAMGDGAPSRFDPDRETMSRPLPVAPPAPTGAVRIPRELAIEAIREHEEEEVPPDDRPSHPAYQPRTGSAVHRHDWMPLNAGFGPNVRINGLGGPVNNGESETSIAAIGSKLVAGWNDGQFFGVQPGFTGYGYSTDGGATWTDGGGLPVASTTDVYYGDPVVAADPAGHFYFASLYRPTTTTRAISVNHATFAGAAPAWSLPVIVASSTVDDLDKEWIAVDPVNGNVYVAYVRFMAAGQRLEFSRSTNHGSTWSAPILLTDPSTSGAMSPRIAIGPGGIVYVAYYAAQLPLYDDYERIRASTNGGLSFGPEYNIGGRSFFNNYFSGPAGYNRERMVAHVSLAVDRTSGPDRGRLYAVWQEMPNIYEDVLGTTGTTNEVESNGSSATATSFTLGRTVQGSLADVNDQDWFSFIGVAGQTVILYMQPNASPCNGFLRMYAGGGGTANRCAYSHFSDGTAIVVYTLPTTATYYLRVLNWDLVPANVGAYTISTGVHGPDPLDLARDQRDVMFSTSSNGGTTWTPPVVVNDDPARFDNSFPEVAVDGAGRVYVNWYDHRADAPNGILTDLYYTLSWNGGLSFSPSAQINDGGSVNWNLVNSNMFPNMGDYSALIADGVNVYANWADGRSLTPDSYFAKLNGAPTAVEPEIEPGSSGLRALPNPSSGAVTFEARGHEGARMWIYDGGGRRIRTLERSASGAFQWDGRDDENRRVAPGIYLHRLEGRSAFGRLAIVR